MGCGGHGTVDYPSLPANVARTNRKRLGRSGLVVTDICMGTMTFGLQADEKTSFAIMDRAVEAGMTAGSREGCSVADCTRV